MATNRDLARELFALARDDATAAGEMAGITSVADGIVGFHAQQAVEKALKSVLAFEDHAFPFTHNIAQLATLAAEAGHELPDALAEVDQLTPYGVRFRYGAIDLADLERQTASEWASTAVAWAESIVNP